MNTPSYDLIVAAVNGDEAALDIIIQHYQPMIEKESGGNPSNPQADYQGSA